MASLAFKNISEVLNRVFGPDGWRVNIIWPDSMPDDFDMAVDIANQTKAAYFFVFRTYTMRDGVGSGGVFSVGVPHGPDSQLIFPDDVPGEDVTDLVGTEDERKHFHFGGDGVNILDVEAYVQILKRYLDSEAVKK